MERNWRVPGRSYSNGACVTVGSWRKPSASLTAGHCVAAGDSGGIVGVRDSKLGDGSLTLEFPPRAWRAFTCALAA